MQLSTIVARPINLFRSPQIRAASPHTSTAGLATLSNKASTPEMRQALCSNLWSRLSAGTVDIADLYSFDKDLLKIVFTTQTPKLKLERLVLTATPGKFEFSFKATGLLEVEMIGRDGKSVGIQKKSYEKDIKATTTAYNLPFFIWMRDTIGLAYWAEIIRSVQNSNKLFAQSLLDLEGHQERTREILAKQHTLPTKHETGVAY